MKRIYNIYEFKNQAEQPTKTRDGNDYMLTGNHRLLKLHTPFPENIHHSWYFVIDDEVVINCKGYIEDRCLCSPQD